MKLRISLFLVLLSVCLKALTQESSFSITFKSDYEEQLQDLAEDSYGNYYGVGRQLRNSGLSEIPIVWKVKRNLDTISAIFPHADSLAHFRFVKYTSDHLLEAFGSIGTQGSPMSSLLYYLMDTGLNVVEKKTITIPGIIKVSITEILYSNSSTYLFVNAIDNQNNQKPGIIKLSSDLSIISSQFYDFSPYGYFNEAFFSADSSQIYTYTRDFNFKTTSPTQLFITDTLLNFNSLKNLPTEQIPTYSYFSYYLSGGLISENRLLICGGIGHGDIHSNQEDIGISIIDTSSTTYAFNYFGGFDTLDMAASFNTCDFKNIDSIFTVSTFNIGQSFYPSIPSFIDVRLYNDSLNLIYERKYGGDAYYWTTNILATSDGGCLIGCHRYDFGTLLQRDTYLLKLNNQGLLVHSKNIQEVQPKPYNLIFTSNREIEVDMLAKNGILKMYDFTGRLLSINKLKPGKNYISNKTMNNHVILLLLIDNQSFTEKL